MLTISKEQFLLVNDKEEYIVILSCKTNLEFLSSVDVLYVDGTFKSTPKFSTNHIQFLVSAIVAISHLYISY